MKPPGIATWLMDRCGTPESVVGDLIERYQTKPSVGWYWRQALMTVGRLTWRDISAHTLAGISALAAGWGALLAVFGVASLLTPRGLLSFGTVWLHAEPSEVTIWTHWWDSLRDPRVASVWCIGFLVSGWLVARFRPTVLLAFVLTVSVWGLSSAGVVLFGPAWHGLRWFTPYADMTTFIVQSTTYLLLVAVIVPLLVFFGGVVGASRQNNNIHTHGGTF